MSQFLEYSIPQKIIGMVAIIPEKKYISEITA